jgi:hypothetical protein
VIQQRYGQQSVLNAAVRGEHRDEADGEIYDDANRVFDSERMDVGRTFEAGVDDVGVVIDLLASEFIGIDRRGALETARSGS